MTLKKKPIREWKGKRDVVVIDGDEIAIEKVGFEVSASAWRKMQQIIIDKGTGNMHKKSQIMRILVNAVVMGIVDLEDLEKQIEKKAEKMDEIIYI